MRASRPLARSRPAALALLLLFPLSLTAPAAAQTVQHTARRPPPLPPQAGCDIYRGVLHGNDPSVQVELRLCPRAPGGLEVDGTLRWSSLRSGWNTREIEGAWADDRVHLTLRDLRIVEERPQPGWRFCAVDRYNFERASSGELRGSYRSDACDDTAQLTLSPVTAEMAQGGSPPSPSMVSDEGAGGSLFGCAVRSGADRGVGAWSLLVAAWIVALKRRGVRARSRDL